MNPFGLGEEDEKKLEDASSRIYIKLRQAISDEATALRKDGIPDGAIFVGTAMAVATFARYLLDKVPDHRWPAFMQLFANACGAIASQSIVIKHGPDGQNDPGGLKH